MTLTMLESDIGRAKPVPSTAIRRVRRIAIVVCAVAASLTLAIFHGFFRDRPPLLECLFLVAAVCAPYLAILGLARPRFHPDGAVAALVLSLVIGVPSVLILDYDIRPIFGHDPGMMNCAGPIVEFLLLVAQWAVIGITWIALWIAHPRRGGSGAGPSPARFVESRGRQ